MMHRELKQIDVSHKLYIENLELKLRVKILEFENTYEKQAKEALEQKVVKITVENKLLREALIKHGSHIKTVYCL